jgi:hypothetical protein
MQSRIRKSNVTFQKELDTNTKNEMQNIKVEHTSMHDGGRQ